MCLYSWLLEPLGVNMRVHVQVHGLEFIVPCGNGTQTCRWLGLAVAQRYALATPHGRCRAREDGYIKPGFFLPAAIIKSNGDILEPKAQIAATCKENEHLTVKLQQQVAVNEFGTPLFTAWTINAFFPSQKREETQADSKPHLSFRGRVKQHQRAAAFETKKTQDGRSISNSNSTEQLEHYTRTLTLQQVNSGHFVSDMEVKVAFLYDWGRLYPEDIENEAQELELVRKKVAAHFAELNAGYLHYATGSNELIYGMNGAEFVHFLHECNIVRVYDRQDQQMVETIVFQSLQHDTLVASHDRGTLSRAGFLHALLRMTQVVATSKGTSLSETLNDILTTQILPTIHRLTCGPFRDHFHDEKILASFQEIKPKFVKLFAKYAQEHASNSTMVLGSIRSSTWPLLLSAVGLRNMLSESGMFCFGTPEEQEALFDRAVDQSFSGMRDVARLEDKLLVFSEFLEVVGRVGLAVLENELDLPPRNAIQLALEAVGSLPLTPTASQTLK